MLVMHALLVGPERAARVAHDVLGKDIVHKVMRVMQPLALPRTLRSEAKREDTLTQLREQVEGADHATDMPTVELTSFSPKTAISFLLAVIIVFVVVGSINFGEVAAAIRGANPWWIAASFGVSLFMFVGAAIPLQAFIPEKIRLGEATLVQVGAALLQVVAPAGLGPAALNLRYLSRKGVSTSSGVATVALIQLVQFLVTVVLLGLVVLFTGESFSLPMPSESLLWGLGVIATLLLTALSIPRVREWLWRKLEPTWEQIQPRVAWLIAHPKRIVYGLAGNVLVTISAVAAFGAALGAFGYTLNPAVLAITYLASNSVGSLIPTPGGVGPVEAALSVGLTAAGIPASVAFSVAILFRLLTFWLRVPLGWLGLRWLQKKDLV